jgi:predicted secreted protein
LYSLPTIEEIGVETPEDSKEVLYPGGESEALRRMYEYMAKEVLSILGFHSFLRE